MKASYQIWKWLTLLFVISGVPGRASDEDILHFVAETSLLSAFSNHLGAEVPVGNKHSGRVGLKPINGFGTTFAGHLTLKDGELMEISLWVDDPRMSPGSGAGLFNRLSQELESRLGKGQRVNDVPNFEDGSEITNQVMLWEDSGSVIMVSLEHGSTRAGLSLHRLDRIFWLSEMGADQGQFWTNVLKGETKTVDSSVQKKHQMSPEISPESVSLSPEGEGSRPIADTAQREFSSFSLWKKVSVGIAVLAGLFWLLLKKKR